MGPYEIRPTSPSMLWRLDGMTLAVLAERPFTGYRMALGEKFWWWSEDFDVSEDSTPGLTITAWRLDGDAAVFQTAEATNGYHESFHWAMLAGVELASPGCWEFTGQYNGRQLSFVVLVPSE